MIKSEEVRNIFCGTECSFDGCPEEMEKLHNYITQQEKVNELLELYKRERSMLEKYINGNYQPMGEHANILKQIDELESELNDNK
jgi:hypothetical protein